MVEFACEKSRSEFQNLIRPPQLRNLAFKPFNLLMLLTGQPGTFASIDQ